MGFPVAAPCFGPGNGFSPRKLPNGGVHFVLFGHTHQQLAERFGRVLVINPGSTGDGRDPRNDRQLSCAVLDTETAEVNIIDFPDPAREGIGVAAG